MFKFLKLCLMAVLVAFCVLDSKENVRDSKEVIQDSKEITQDSKKSILDSKETTQDSKSDAQKIADIFYTLNFDKNHPRQKINHAQGFCASGTFSPSLEAQKNFDIPILNEPSLSASARYSLGGALKSDKSKGRGLALRLQGKSETWSIVALNTEINFAKNPQEFIEFFQARIPQNGRVDNEKIKILTQNTPSFKNFESYMQKVGITPSVANTAYYSIHTFYFKDKSGKMLPAKFEFMPTNGVKYASKQELENLSDSFLESNFKTHIAKRPITYKMYLILANKNDAINDTTALWSGSHKKILVGTLSINGTNGSACNDEVYFPSDIPKGVGEPTDALFSVRNEAYAITFTRRQE